MDRHVFIAVKLPDSTKKRLAGMCRDLTGSVEFKTWVYPEDYHITLAFLGKADRTQLKELTGSLEERLKDVHAFDLQIDHFGFFGQKERPRIFWAGLFESDSLIKLQEKVAEACHQSGFQLEKRTYFPHITLARKYVGEDLAYSSVAEWWNSFGKATLFNASSVVVYETHFEKKPKYQEIHAFELNE